MSIPGFTAENALNRNNPNYRAAAVNKMTFGLNSLRPSLKNKELGYVDCKEWPNNLFCRECGATGPDSAICCPNNYCIINNPPDDAPAKNWGFHGPLAGGVLARR